MDRAEADPTITEVYLHVQVSNEDAKSFYLARGFEEKEVIKDYYKNIDPPDCFLLSKTISRSSN